MTWRLQLHAAAQRQHQAHWEAQQEHDEAQQQKQLQAARQNLRADDRLGSLSSCKALSMVLGKLSINEEVQRSASVESVFSLGQRKQTTYNERGRTSVKGRRISSRQKAPPGIRRILSIHLGICTSARCASQSAYDMPAGASRSPASSTYLD